ncbi:DUF1772 domain-containing protein [Allorhizocola rhizosphaerae]|uniref:anthrone oxygenase family protein n=1 Tax=Allorhizocola rhizosphaerae TaxID=1872709 RepID=UPI000E3DA0ED|nr:anthrone oxygenase family protein [Allorhizocola rhizosphaerae]
MWTTAVLIAATVTMGWVAGLFYAYWMSVMPGLARSGDRTFVEAMKRINVAILNGWFALGFAGAVVFTALGAVLTVGEPPFVWVLAALALYVAQLAVTFGVNVPLNNALDAAPADTEHAATRQAFEAKWVRFNHVRTVLTTLALGCLAWALVEWGRVVA